ncbi:MAG: hypothetical protein HYU66_21560, partial [Armatimonadetes bacterium]|nr:hypothetical protein [Armatimonadota bacterium]
MFAFAAAALLAGALAADRTLVDFEDPARDAVFTSAAAPAAAVTDERASQGRRCLRMAFEQHAPGKGEWPGVTFKPADAGAPGDWSGYAFLLLDVATGNADASEIGVSISGGADGKQNWYTYAPVPPGGWTTLRFPLTDLAATLDLTRIASIYLLMRRPPEPTVLFVDNLRLATWDLTDPAVLDVALVSPSFHGAYFHSHPEDQVAVRIAPQAPPAEFAGTLLRLTVLRPDGTEVGRVEAAPGQQPLLAVPKPALRDGDRLTARFALLRDGQPLQQREFAITQHPPARDEVLLRDDGVTLVNGEPFFPLGIYQAPVSQFGYLKQLGFNTVQTYSPADTAYLKAAQEAGLRVITQVQGTHAKAPYYHEPEWSDEEVAAYVRSIMDSPALLAYYLYDEPTPGRTPPEKLNRLCDLPRGIDPYHLAAGCNNGDQLTYRGVADAMMVDCYPAPGRFTDLVARTVAGRAAQVPNRALWFIPQSFPWEPYCRARNGNGPGGLVFEDGRLPTYRELRTMPWLTIALGAKGLCYYSFQVQGFWIREAYPAFWRGYEHHLAELTALFPWLLEHEPDRPVACDAPPVYVSARQRGDDLFIVAANSSDQPQKAVLTVPGLAGRQLTVVSEARHVTPVGERVELAFEPFETHLLTTAPQGLESLPAVTSVEAEVARLQAEQDAAYPSLCTFQQGARLEASWGFPDANQALWSVWYRVIDGWPNTPWRVGEGFRTEAVPEWGKKDFTSAGRWLEVRLPEPREINTVTVIASPWATVEVRLWVDGAWRTVPGEVVPDAVPRHHDMPSA